MPGYLKKLAFLSLFLIANLLTGIVQSTPLNPEDVPTELKPWIEWALHDQPEALCPFNSQSTRVCEWDASQIQLDLSNNNGAFKQHATLFQDGWVTLPGDDHYWPQEIRVNGQALGALSYGNLPQIFLKKGGYEITGKFFWDSLPDSLTLPSEAGIVRVSINGKTEPFPYINADGKLWLGENETGVASQEDTLDIRINRKVTDSIPMIMTTHLDIRVSGKNRELILENILLPGFITLSSSSDLANQIENDGRLRIQLRPGNWTVEVQARHDGPINDLTLPKPTNPELAMDEIWVFEAQNQLRLAKVEGAPSVDPQQTTLPDAWKNLPAYQVVPGSNFKIVEHRRGGNPNPDQLRLHRRIWLDFDGKGYSFQDTLSGTLSQSWRLDVNAPLKLGRITVNGEPQLITQTNGQKSGFEVREGSIRVSSDSRLDGAQRKLLATGWDHDFQQLSGELHLPPGWRLMATSGIDEASGTWVSSWTLLDLFIVLMVALIFLKLWGIRWGLLALLGMILTFKEPGAPQYLWLLILIGQVFLRIIAQGWLKKFFKAYKFATLLALILITTPFMVKQVREGIYPVLGTALPPGSPQFYNYGAQAPNTEILNDNAPMGGAPKPNQAFQQPDEFDKKDLAVEQKALPSTTLGEKEEVQIQIQDNTGYARSFKRKTLLLNQVKYKPGAKVQTGPGLPNWQWQVLQLKWNGPVQKDAQIKLWLMGPTTHLILVFFQLFLLIVLILRLLELPDQYGGTWVKTKIPFFLIPLIFILTTTTHTPKALADLPNNELLTELANRLTETPACFPNCATVSHMQISAQGDQLILTLKISVAAPTAIALPGNLNDWSPQEVTTNGTTTPALRRDQNGLLWLQVSPGVSEITLKGALPNRSQVNLTLPTQPFQVHSNLSGWKIDGLKENGQVGENIQLSRLSPSSATQSLQPGNYPPFVEVERHLYVGLVWKLETKIRRVSPLGSPVFLEVPLLPGESITTSDIKVDKGKALITLGAQNSQFEWESVLQETPDLELIATQSSNYVEIWKAEASPIWHLAFEGIPPIHTQDPDGVRIPEWRPWSQEKVRLHFSRPEALAGQTLTIDESKLIVRPGLRSSENTLSFSVRSSLGGQHSITLPNGSVLKSVSIDGNVQPIGMDQNKITLPLKPGAQNFEIAWSQNQGMSFFFRSPKIDLGNPNVNASINVEVGVGRWILWADGPMMGPAVLFWSYLIILAIFAFALSRLSITPIKSYEWLLLGLGLTQIPIWASIIIAGWLLFLGLRKKKTDLNPYVFDLRQLVIIGWTFISLLLLLYSIEQGLLGHPDMQIVGNGSNGSYLNWFQDRTTGALPTSWIISVPLYIYRIAMLLWALWLSFALLRWIRWGWQCFTEGGAWRSLTTTKAAPRP